MMNRSQQFEELDKEHTKLKNNTGKSLNTGVSFIPWRSDKRTGIVRA